MSAQGLCAELAFFTVDQLSEEADQHGLQSNTSLNLNNRALKDQHGYLQTLPLEIMLLIAEKATNGALYFVGKRWQELLYREDKDVDQRRICATGYCTFNDDLGEAKWNYSHGRLRWLLKQPWLMASHFTRAYWQHVKERVRHGFEEFFDMYPISAKRLRRRVRPRFERILNASFLNNDGSFTNEFSIRGPTVDKGPLAFVVCLSGHRRGGMAEVRVDVGLGASTAYLPRYRRPDFLHALTWSCPPTVGNCHTLPLSLLRGPWDARTTGVMEAWVYWFWSGVLPLPLSEKQLRAAADGLQAKIEGSAADALGFLPAAFFRGLHLLKERGMPWHTHIPWGVATSFGGDGFYLPVSLQARHVRRLAGVALRHSEDAAYRFAALEMIAAYLSLDAQLCPPTLREGPPQAGSIDLDDCSHLLSEFRLIASTFPDRYKTSRQQEVRKHFIPRSQYDSQLARLQAGVARAAYWLKSGHLDMDPDDDETEKEKKVHDESQPDCWASHAASIKSRSVSSLAPEYSSTPEAIGDVKYPTQRA